MLHSYYFSASGTTERIVKAMAVNLSDVVDCHDITSGFEGVVELRDDTSVVIFAAPVYAGRIPTIAAERFRRIKGSGQKCVAVVVYGNRDYDDALVELCDLVRDQGFELAGAAAFVARHCIFPQVASMRPDAEDFESIARFCAAVEAALDAGVTLDLSKVKGSRPYKAASAVPLHPEVDKARCHSCGKCARLCPAGAISLVAPQSIDAGKCIACTRCIAVCPDKARSFGGVKYSIIAPLFKMKCSKRCEPEWFVAE